jgi:hypothetical protein
MDILGATDFVSSGIWTGLRFVLSILLSFIRPACRKIQVANITSYLNAGWILAWLPRSLDWPASMGHWVGLVTKAMPSRPVRCGEGILRQPFSDPQELRRRGMGRVVVLSVVTPYAIRDGPIPRRQRPGEFVQYDNRAAA